MNGLVERLVDWCTRKSRIDTRADDSRLRRIALHTSRGAQLAGIVGEVRRERLQRKMGFIDQDRNAKEHGHG